MRSAPWKHLKNKLRDSEERFFEREVERLLLPRFPTLVQTPSKQRLDRAGIDLVARNDAGEIEVAVQCKGFAVSVPGVDQIRQARESLAAFATSDEKVKLYIFVHNRDGRAHELAETVQALLNDLVRTGKCDAVEFYDLDTFMHNCREVMRAYLSASLRRAANRKLRELREIFEVVGDPLMEVPVKEDRLYIGLTDPPRFEEIAPTRARNVGALISTRSDAKFTLLIGNFGSGKTTAGLLAASADEESDPTIVFAEAAYFPVDRLGSGLSPLLEEALRASGVFSEIAREDHGLFRLAAPLLREELGNRGEKLGTTHKYAFILDGLDENRFYVTPEGVATLTNSMADLHCPIVLTTRREHFIATFESMKVGTLVFGKKHGWKKPIGVFSLEPWRREDVQRFVTGSANILRLDGRTTDSERLLDFLRLLEKGEERNFYGELAAHPLFLRLILDDIVANGIRNVGRATLLLEWALYKILRDLKRKTQNRAQDWQFDRDFTGRIMMVMEDVAFQMTDVVDDRRVLTEFLSQGMLEQIAKRYFPGDSDVLITVLLNSLLVPRHFFENAKFTVHFIYRIFHEFFVACYAVRSGVSLDIGDTHVAEFMSELTAKNFAWSATPPRRVL